MRRLASSNIAQIAQASTPPSPADSDATYPKPAGWEYVTHEGRYEALRSEPNPDSEALRNALLHAKQNVQRNQGDKTRAFQEARRAHNPGRRIALRSQSFWRANPLTLKVNLVHQCNFDIRL